MLSSKIFWNDHCTVKNKQPPKPREVLYILVCLYAFFDYMFVYMDYMVLYMYG